MSENRPDILNVGAKPTFVTAVRQEVIDLSLATANIVSDISGWRVSDEESLSDHRYIKFSIKSDRVAQTKWRNPRATRWDAYYADLEKALGGPTGCVNTSDDIEKKEVSQLQNGLITSFKNNCKEKRHYPRKSATWWYPELDKMRKQCNRNIRRASRNQIDWETASTVRRNYKKAIRQCKRETWRRFCESVNGPRPASRLFKILNKDQIINLDSIQIPNGTGISSIEEVLGYLLDTHFPGNTPYSTTNTNNTCQESEEDWLADTIVT